MFSKLRGDNEMDVSKTDDIILSPLSSPTHIASTIERDLAEHYEHFALLSCNHIAEANFRTQNMLPCVRYPIR